jgi:leader peptidase (prepilin peptidase)/N-methyltransferase
MELHAVEEGVIVDRAGMCGASTKGLGVRFSRANPAGMGFGDVRLATLIGAAVSFSAGLPAAVVAAGGACVAAVLVAVAARRRSVPFAPLLVAAGLIALVAAGVA